MTLKDRYLPVLHAREGWFPDQHVAHIVLKCFKAMLPAKVKDRFLETYNHPAFPREIRFKKYRVRRGDSLPRIARRFRVSLDAIRDLNGLGRYKPLRSGMRIYLPMQ